MTICPRCDGPLRAIPEGHACNACKWEWITVDVQPVTAHAEDVDVLTDGNAIRTPYGLCTGFDNYNPPWRQVR